MTTLRISITKEVLEATKDCPDGEQTVTNCAIAYAVRNIWPKAEVHAHDVYPSPEELIHPEGFAVSFPHFQELFISRFDCSTPAERAAMQPFSFEIEVPDEVIGEVNIEEIRGICEGSKTLELV